MKRSWIVAVIAAALYVGTGQLVAGVTGVVRTVSTTAPPDEVMDSRLMPRIDVAGIDTSASAATGLTAAWRGVWDVPDDGLYDLTLESQGHSTWTIDDVLAHEGGVLGSSPVLRTVWLTAGFHRIEVRCALDAIARICRVSAARSGREADLLTGASLKPRLPRYPLLRSLAHLIQLVFGAIGLVAAVLAVRGAIGRLSFRPRLPLGWRRALAWIFLAGIVAHGALLRLDVITAKYGVVRSPAWLAAVQTRTVAPPASIRPGSMTWALEPLYPHRDGPPTHYLSDPYTYLDAARKMPYFYAAHWREPVFPFATKIALKILDNQDVAVSFASAFFSTLAIWLTYLLGALVWSRPAGLVAALGLSLDHDVLAVSGIGWRDDAYMAAFLMCAALILRVARSGPHEHDGHDEPVWWRVGRFRIDRFYLDATIAGAAGGLAVLTRIMAVPFLGAAACCLLLARRVPWRRRAAATALATTTAMLVAAPYFINCWRVYGDPLYTFNVHGNIYSAAEGQAPSGTTASYVTAKLERHPVEMADTIARGLTTYPFGNKGAGLDRWMPGAGAWTMRAAIVGMLVLAAFARGRLLLCLLVTSLIPFSVTWTIDADYRFTMHAYPILLVAAAVALGAGVRLLRAMLVPAPDRATDLWLGRPTWLPWLGTVGAALATLVFVTRLSPPLVFAETLRAGQDAMVEAGVRDAWAFGRGWSTVFGRSSIAMRMTAGEGAVSIRLPDARDYPLTLRMDPFPRPLPDVAGPWPTVEVSLNGTAIADVPLTWAPERVGSYALVLPGAVTRRGSNTLLLRVKTPNGDQSPPGTPNLSSSNAIGLWYVRVHP